MCSKSISGTAATEKIRFITIAFKTIFFQFRSIEIVKILIIRNFKLIVLKPAACIFRTYIIRQINGTLCISDLLIIIIDFKILISLNIIIGKTPFQPYDIRCGNIIFILL